MSNYILDGTVGIPIETLLYTALVVFIALVGWLIRNLISDMNKKIDAADTKIEINKKAIEDNRVELEKKIGAVNKTVEDNRKEAEKYSREMLEKIHEVHTDISNKLSSVKDTLRTQL